MKKINNNAQVSIIFLFWATVLLFSSCKRHPEMPITIVRMEQTLFTLPVDSISVYVPQLQQLYGDLLIELSIETGIALPDAPEFPEELAGFITYPDMVITFERVMEKYPDMNEFERELGRAFYNYKKYFPDRAIPSVYTLIAGFNSRGFVTNDLLAISIEHYLGKDDDIYSRLMLPNYERRLKDRKYLLVDCLSEWTSYQFPFNDSINSVLANILYHGKIKYAVQQLIPTMPDSILFGFTPDQMRWCRNNTAQMYTFFVENRLLFSTDQFTINKLVGPSPFTSLFTSESPGRAAVWLGYRIIAAYMKREKASLEELLLNYDYQQILHKAKFKP